MRIRIEGFQFGEFRIGERLMEALHQDQAAIAIDGQPRQAFGRAVKESVTVGLLGLKTRDQLRTRGKRRAEERGEGNRHGNSSKGVSGRDASGPSDKFRPWGRKANTLCSRSHIYLQSPGSLPHYPCNMACIPSVGSQTDEIWETEPSQE